MRRVPILASFLMLLLLHPLAALGGEMTAPTTWEGYLFKDEQGRLRIGYPVYGSVMRGAALEVGGKLREKLEPYACGAKGDFFWWTSWLGEGKPGEKLVDVSVVPRFLVRIRGQAEEVEGEKKKMPGGGFDWSASNARLVMSEGRVVHVEFISVEWLNLWRMLERMMDAKTGKPSRGTDAKTLLDVLLEMEKAGDVTDSMKEKAAGIDGLAKVRRYHQKNAVGSAVKWVMKRLEAGEEGIEAARSLPVYPLHESSEGYWLSNLFRKSDSRQDFLEKVRTKWSGDLGEIEVGYWVVTPGHEWADSCRVDEVEEFWTDDEFLQLQASTRKERGK